MKEYLKNLYAIYASAFLAGICISIGGTVNLKAGGFVGPVMFSFGLITVVHYAFKLYTGTAGFIQNSRDFINLIHILIGNIIGCWVTGQLIALASPDIICKAQAIAASRMAAPWYSLLILGAGCGFIMTTAVKFARQGKWLPLVFGVPVFIMCGFYHCIADAFYYCLISARYLVTPAYLLVVLGNFIGCNLTRTLYKEP